MSQVSEVFKAARRRLHPLAFAGLVLVLIFGIGSVVVRALLGTSSAQYDPSCGAVRVCAKPRGTLRTRCEARDGELALRRFSDQCRGDWLTVEATMQLIGAPRTARSPKALGFWSAHDTPAPPFRAGLCGGATAGRCAHANLDADAEEECWCEQPAGELRRLVRD